MRKLSQFAWKQYLEYNRPDINIRTFRTWCTKNRPKKQIFDTEQELLQAVSLYDKRIIYSQFNWRKYLQQNRQDISIDNFIYWSAKNRPKKQVFDTEQELIEAISLYDNRIKRSQFSWKQYLQEKRKDISIDRFKDWCFDYRPKKSVFDKEQELIEAISLYDNRIKRSQFSWKQYLQEKRKDISIEGFKSWCNRYRQKKQIFDTEQELLEALLLYDIAQKYLIRKTQYDGIYNIIEKETGLKFNFYRLEDMIGLIK